VAVFYGKNDCFGRVIRFGRVETALNGGIYGNRFHSCDSFDSIVESREDATNRTNGERRSRRI
jgi:hypothetical protein